MKTKFQRRLMREARYAGAITRRPKAGQQPQERVHGLRYETKDEMGAMSFANTLRYSTTGNGCTRHWATSRRCSS